uniref:Uncharacterized protein n=1 Tax=Tanacetum cinerariifolium TaxID=118510 RepID=A0A6L2KTA5_TANCI|nr:hypothetical protein [Tanacetum cinerariifolium]
MDIFAFIHTSDPTKVRVLERERNENEPRLLDTTIGRTVPLLPVAPDRTESELKASVERQFDEGGSGNQTKQGDSARGGPDANIQPVVEAVNTVVENAAHVQSRRQGKRKSIVVDAGRVSHPPKNLRDDHGTSSGASIGGKSRSALQRLLARAVLSAEVGVAVIPTLPFVTASVSTTPEREDEDHTDFMSEPNLRTIEAPRRFVISSDSYRHFGTNVAEAEVDSLTRSFIPIMTTVTTTTSNVSPTLVTKEKFVEPFSFGAGFSFAGGNDPITGVFSDLTGSDYLVGVIRTTINPDTDLQKFFTSVRGMEHDHLFTEFNVGAARQMSLNIESLKARLLMREAEAAKAIRLRAEASNFKSVEKSLWDETNALREHNVILEKDDVMVTELETSAMSKERELTDLNALVTSVKSQNDSLADRLEKFQDDRMKIVEYKFEKLYNDFVEMSLHLEEKFCHHLLTNISGHRWLLTHGMKLAIANCMNSPEYLSALRASIGKAIENNMQDGLSARITHGKEGRVLSDVATYNPFAKVDYISAIQQLQNVNFSLLARLKSSKDASVETVMDILHQVVIGATALSLAVDVSSAHVRKISFDSTIAPISVDDYEVMGADDQAVADENAASFPSVDDRSRLISKSSSFFTKSTSAVLNVGMPISAGMTAFVPYVNENRVSPLLDFIMVRPLVCRCLTEAKCWRESKSTDNDVARKIFELIAGNGCYWFCFNPLCEVVNGYYQEFDFPSSSTNTCLLKCTKLVDAILLSASAFLFSLLGNCLIENALKPLDDPLVNRIHGSGSSSSISIRVFGESSFGRSTMKSANIFPLTDTLGWSVITMIGCA